MNNKILYFGYGSNLDYLDWNAWCEKKGYDPSGLVELGPAWLPDFEMRFHYHSSGRKGGAADVVEMGEGCAVPGALFEMDEKTLAAMDEKEGHPDYYERRDVHVSLADGRIVKALTYTVVDDKIRDHHVLPTEDYEDLIYGGLMKLGLPTEELTRAVLDKKREGADKLLNHVFVYGTLMESCKREDVIWAIGPSNKENAKTKGRLMDLGDYPGMKPDVRDGIIGELYTFPDIERALSRLDRIEGFDRDDHENSLFLRTIVKVLVNDRFEWAWTYIYNGDDGVEIPSGDWRNRNY